MYKHKHNKPTYLHSLPKLLRLFVVTENYQVNHMSFDHSGTIFFSLGFCSASHAESSFVGASDIGQWFTPGSRCNFGSRWNLNSLTGWWTDLLTSPPPGQLSLRIQRSYRGNVGTHTIPPHTPFLEVEVDPDPRETMQTSMGPKLAIWTIPQLYTSLQSCGILTPCLLAAPSFI